MVNQPAIVMDRLFHTKSSPFCVGNPNSSETMIRLLVDAIQ